MTDDDRKRVLARLIGGWDKRLSDDTYTIWCEELDRLDFSPAYAAARNMVRNNRYFPTISEFFTEYATHVERQQAGPATVCPHCDRGWQEHDNKVVACAFCRPAVYENQMRGFYQSAFHEHSRVDNCGDITDPQPDMRAFIASLKGGLGGRHGGVLAGVLVGPSTGGSSE